MKTRIIASTLFLTTLAIATSSVLGMTSSYIQKNPNTITISNDIMKSDYTIQNDEIIEDHCLINKKIKPNQSWISAPFKFKEQNFNYTFSNETNNSHKFKIKIINAITENIQFEYNTEDNNTDILNVELPDTEYRVLIENTGESEIENINVNFHSLH